MSETVLLSNLRILLVEDSPDQQRLFAKSLQHAGAEVFLECNGIAAVSAVRRAREPFDAVIMDLAMPLMDGIEATYRLRENGYEGPILGITAYECDETRESWLESGCTAYLRKPLDRTVFVETLQAIVAKRTPLDQDSGFPADDAGSPVYSSLEADPVLGELVKVFVKEVPARVEELESHATREDWESLRRVAHQWKGSFGSHGFGQVTPLAQRLECAIRDDETPNQILAAVQDLTEMAHRIAIRPSTSVGG